MNVCRNIRHLTLYEQRPGTDPSAIALPPNVERVELMTKGRGWVWHEEDWVEVQPGDLLWHLPGERTIGRSDHSNPYQCLNLGLDVSDASQRAVPRITRWPNLLEARAFADDLLQRWIDPDFPKDLLAAYAVGRLLYQAKTWHMEQQQTLLPGQVRAARAHIEAHFRERVTLEELGQVSGCSVPHLLQLFRQHGQRSPHQEILATRLREAARLLSTSHVPIKQIAADLGFAHASAFCQAFVKYAGTSPAAYRRKGLRT